MKKTELRKNISATDVVQVLPLVDVAVSHSDPHLETFIGRVWKLLQDLKSLVIGLVRSQQILPVRRRSACQLCARE